MKTAEKKSAIKFRSALNVRSILNKAKGNAAYFSCINYIISDYQ